MCAHDICTFLFLTRDNGRRVVPYLKEAGLAGNLPGQLQGTYIHCCVLTYIRTILESMPRVECTEVMSLFRLVKSFPLSASS